MNTDLPFSVLTANIISLLLLGTLYLSNYQKMNFGKDMRLVRRMMGITAIANVADCCVYYFNGTSNIFFRVLVFLSGSWLYLGNVLIGSTWAQFLMTHLNIPFTDTRRKLYRTGRLIACILLILNLFYPLVFSVQNGIYQRGPAYGVFLLLAILYILDSLHLYAACRKRTGVPTLFPVHVFLLPIVIGVGIQAVFMETAITWPSIAIAIAGVLTALKNEIIFLDGLTGLYNRMYLEYLQKQAYKKKNV